MEAPPKFSREPLKNQFVELKLRLQFFLHQEIFKRQNVWHSSEYSSPEPSKIDPKNQLFWTLDFFDISKYLKDNFLHDLGIPTPKWTFPKITFWNLNLTIDFSQLGSYAELA